MMEKIAIFGAGGFGREVACLINRINEEMPESNPWQFIGFFDDGIAKGSRNEYGEILGGVKELNEWEEDLAVVIAIGSPRIVELIVNKLTSPKLSFPNIIAPDVIFFDQNNCRIGKGNIISYASLISCNVEIGDHNILNGYVTVGHDTTIGNYNSFMPNVKVSGEVRIGDKNYFGVGSTILQQITVGNNTTVGANSLIIRKTKDGVTYVGSPATILKY